MTVTGIRLLTADDLLCLHSQGVRGELIRGVLYQTTASGHEHGRIVMRLGALLYNVIEPEGLGRLVGSDYGVLLERDPDTVREPDIAFTSAERLPLDARIDGYAEIAPDLVVEIRSPSDGRREMHDKARMWLSYGVRLVWVMQPDTRTVEVHRPDQAVSTLAGVDTLDGGAVLPDFACALDDVFGP